MPEPIGSVYLDQPRPGRDRARPPKRGARTALAAQLSLLGILGLTVAGFLVLVRAVVGSPDPAVDAIQAALEDPESRAEIQNELAGAIEEQLLSPELIDLAEVHQIDYEAQIEAWAASVLDDPAFGEAVADLVTDVHGQMFVERRAEPIDTGPLTDIVMGHATETAPALAPLLPPGGQLVTIDVSGLPDLTTPMAALDQAIFISLLCGFALLLAFAVHERRHRVIAWIGRWLLVGGVVLGIGAVGIPSLVGRLTGWVTLEAAARPESIRLLAPAAVIGAAGMGLTSAAAVWHRREKRRVAQEGAAAWLEVVEPPPSTLPSSAELDLARRGLVDGSRHLTNI